MVSTALIGLAGVVKALVRCSGTTSGRIETVKTLIVQRRVSDDTLARSETETETAYDQQLIKPPKPYREFFKARRRPWIFGHFSSNGREIY